MTVSGLTIIKRVSNLVFKEFRENKSLLFQIIGISFLCAILKHIQSSFGGNVSEIAFYVCYMLIIVLIIASFTNITTISINAINKLTSFMEIIIPTLIALMIGMGNISTVIAMQPIILTLISIISVIVSKLVIPIIVTSTILNLIGNISKQVNVESLSKFMKKTVIR